MVEIISLGKPQVMLEHKYDLTCGCGAVLRCRRGELKIEVDERNETWYSIMCPICHKEVKRLNPSPVR